MSHIPPRNIGFGYDWGLGVDQNHIKYIQDSHIIQSRISPMPCYLLQRASGGINVGYSGARITPLDSSYYVADNQYKLILWNGGSNHPDTRSYVNDNIGNIFIYINNVRATRVLSPADIIADNEIAIIERKDTDPHRVEIVFNTGFSPLSKITYFYLTLEDGIEDLSIKRGDSANQSLFGWTQYINSYEDDFQKQNQVLVRFPINLNDIIVSEEGRVMMENRDSWMIWTPYVNDFDILIVAEEDSPDGELRYEIVNSTNSIIQRTLTLQKFKLNLLESADDRYKIPYLKVT